MSDIDPLFATHKLNNDGVEKVAKIRETFTEFLRNLEQLCNDKCREFSLVRTKLEEASFFAVKAIAIVPDNQEQQQPPPAQP